MPETGHSLISTMILQTSSGLDYVPQRIISLVPSQTELLFTFGLENETVGITKFCVHPKAWFKTKVRVGGTKTVNTDLIHQLNPDLIIANKEENVKDQIEALAADYPVWLTDVNNLSDALQMIADIGILTGKPAAGYALIDSISKAFNKMTAIEKPVKTAYLIWRKPYMTIGSDTFIHDMLHHCGFENIFAHEARYPEINIRDLQIANCRLLLLSSEPYPFKQKHIEELKSFLPQTKIILADGEFFSWYGSRLLQAPGYFKKLIECIS
jgi:ABC-type Fe3+-hydroxamate transport system substrate-binding protein